MQVKQTQNYFHLLQSIPQSSRDAYRQAMLKVPQLQGSFESQKVPYPNEMTVDIGSIKHHLYIWKPQKQPSGIMLLLHGMDGHCGTSGYLAKNLAEKNNMLVVGLDFRNFGKTTTTDKKGYISDMMLLVQDAQNILNWLKTSYNCKIFVGGLSMGGAVAFRMAIRNPKTIAGIILFAPAIRQNVNTSPFMKKVAKVVGWLMPSLQLSNKNGSSFASKYKVSNFAEDPLNYSGKVMPGSVRTVLNFQEECSEMFHLLETPYLIFMGGVDKIVDPFIVVDLDKYSKSTDKSAFCYKDMWHVIWGSEDMKDVTIRVVDWTAKRL